MTKTISAKKKYKKCLRINTVLANVGLCAGGHLWLRHICIIHRDMKTRHCISGYDRIVPSGLEGVSELYGKTDNWNQKRRETCSILREQDRDAKQKTNRIQRLPNLKGTHTIGFPPAKLQLFHKPARGWMIFLFQHWMTTGIHKARTAAMSCQRWLGRWRTSMAAACYLLLFFNTISDNKRLQSTTNV